MLAYGNTKLKGSQKYHPSNQCCICSNEDFKMTKTAERREGLLEIQEQLDANLVDLWGCGDDCPYCNGYMSEISEVCYSCGNSLCDCEICSSGNIAEGKGWKKC
jgi:hypothetical protein